MAVKIRLKRMGKIRTPHYRIVVIDARKKRDGRAIEQIGQYHPKNDPSVIVVDSERAQHWLSVGAQPTEAVVALFKRTGDWQKFSGDTSPAGVTGQPERVDKLARFNAALAEIGEEPVTDAIDRSGQPKGKSEEESADESSSSDEGAKAKPAKRAAAKKADKPEAKSKSDAPAKSKAATDDTAEAAAAAATASDTAGAEAAAAAESDTDQAAD